MLKNLLFLLLLSFLVLTCKPGAPKLPEDRPADFKLDYNLDGGMSDYSVDINIFSDSCHFRKRQEGKVIEKTVKIAPQDLNAVYELLKKNEFDKFETMTDKAIVYDRGGETISVHWDQRTITVSNAQNKFVTEKWYEKWKMLCEGLDGFAGNKFK